MKQKLMKHIIPYSRFINESVEEMEQITSLILNGGFELDIAMEMIKHLNSDDLLELKKVLLNRTTEEEIYKSSGDQASALFNLLGLSDLPILLNLIGKSVYDAYLIPRPGRGQDGVIDLFGMQLTSLPNSIGDCLGIRRIDISANSLVELPEGFAKLKNITEVIAGGNSFEKFPPQLLELPMLSDLILSHNPISEIPKEIEKLTKLRSLYLEGTGIQLLPEELFNLPNLNKIEISFELLELPANIKNSSIRFITLEHCMLKSLPEGIGESNLIELILYGNQFTEFPPQLFTSKKLQLLNLSNNNISSIPNEISQISNLETLYLSGNRNLVDLPIDALLQLEQLNYLELKNIGIAPEKIKEFEKIFEAAGKRVRIIY